MVKTLKEWKSHLNTRSLEALVEVAEQENWPDELPFSANEILDLVVTYEGGVATGTEIRALVAEIYSVSLCDLGDRETFEEGVYEILEGDVTGDHAEQIMRLYDRTTRGWVAE